VPALLCSSKAAEQAFAGRQPRQRWLLPIDGTPVSMSAVEYVIAHADRARTHIHLVNVQPPVTRDDVRVLAPARVVAHMRRSAGEEVLSNARALLNKAGFEHTIEVAFGTPAEAIVRTATEHACTRIVMGSRLAGAISKILRASVVTHVLRLAHMPVTIIKVNTRKRLLGENYEKVAHHDGHRTTSDDLTLASQSPHVHATSR